MEQLIQKIRELKMNKKVLVLGAAVIDMIIEIDRLPKSGEDVAADQKESIVGGCAYNVSGYQLEKGILRKRLESNLRKTV